MDTGEGTPNNTTFSHFSPSYNHFRRPIKDYTSNIFSKNCGFSHHMRGRRGWEYFIIFTSLLTIMEITFVCIVYPEIRFAYYVPFFLIDIIHMIDNRVIRCTIFFLNGVEVDDHETIKNLYGRISLILHDISCVPLSWIGIVAHSPITY